MSTSDDQPPPPERGHTRIPLYCDIPNSVLRRSKDEISLWLDDAVGYLGDELRVAVRKASADLKAKKKP